MNRLTAIVMILQQYYISIFYIGNFFSLRKQPFLLAQQKRCSSDSACTDWTKQLIPSAFCPHLHQRPTSWLETAASDWLFRRRRTSSVLDTPARQSKPKKRVNAWVAKQSCSLYIKQWLKAVICKSTLYKLRAPAHVHNVSRGDMTANSISDFWIQTGPSPYSASV